jgi:hypothetical protein
MGKHYGPKVAALWVDGGWELDSLANTPWADLTAAAKAGHPQRLVSYSPGIEKHTLFTPYQDYWAGELCRLNFIPRGDLTPSGLPWHAFVSWHGDSRNRIIGYWMMSAANRALDWQPPSPESAAGFFRGFQRVGGAVTFNLFCYQDGSVYPPDLETMKGLKSLVRG